MVASSYFTKRGLEKGLLKKLTDTDEKLADTSETIYISALALLKMIKHGQDGVPLEVMGLMMGEQVDDYTIHVVDVFAMPQTASGITVEAIDAVFQTKMLEMLKRIGRKEVVVGWYHSHPGFGCWLSNVDCQTQANFESMDARAVAVVVDPIQSVKGKVVIDAFRSINTVVLISSQDIRSVTSNLGHIRKPSLISIVHGLNRHYYSLIVSHRRDYIEENMLKNLHKQTWTKPLIPQTYEKHTARNLFCVTKMNALLKNYETFCKEEGEIKMETFAVMNVGRKDPRKHLFEISSELSCRNVSQSLTGEISTLIF